MRNLFQYLRPYAKQAILGPFFKLIEAIFELIVPLVVAYIIDVGIAQRDEGIVARMGLVLVLLAVVGLACALICQYYASKASQGVGTLLRNRLFAHIQRLSSSQIDQIGTPKLITHVTSDIDQVQLGIAMLIRLAIRAVFLIIGATVMAITIDGQLALVFFLAAPLVTLAVWLVMRASVPLYLKIQGQLDRIARITRENLLGIRVIRAFRREDGEQDRFAMENQALSMEAVRVGRIASLLNPISYLIINMAILMILWLGAFRVDTGTLTQGQLIAFISYLTQIMLTLIVAANVFIIYTKAFASLSRVQTVLDVVPDTRQAALPSLSANSYAIEYRHVSFVYPGAGQAALTDLSFSIAAGQAIGIIGGTGSGKTTMIQLLMGIYPVTQGAILLNGQDIAGIAPDQLGRIFGIVPQKAVLVSGTIRQNMQWRKADATEEEITKALKAAQALDFVMAMPAGIDSLVQQGGVNFSGGQRQRLTIARALVGGPSALVLDDSASALDMATDLALRRAIAALGITTITISQRIGSIRHADQILVLDDGRLAGMGSHSQLLAECEIYREIVQLQSRASQEVTG